MLHTIPEAIEEIKQGKLIIVVDDEDRENEGDFVTAAENVTPEIVNFMATHGRGLICAPLTDLRCRELNLQMMVQEQANTAAYATPFTVSVDLLTHGNTTGISAADRSRTIRALVDETTRPEDLGRPGHIFPLRARDGGVLRRAGHTEAACDLARLAGKQPAGVLVEIMNEDGSMARLPDLLQIAERFQLKIVSIKDLIEYRLRNESLIERVEEVEMPTEYGSFRLRAYRQKNSDEIHLALIKGEWREGEAVLVRVHSSCVTGDIFGSCRCDCGQQLHAAMQMVEQAGQGVVLYMQQEGRGIGLVNKLRAYRLQEGGMDTVEANLKLGFKMDERDYGVGAQILKDLGVQRMKLISNNPAKRAGITGYGLEIAERVALETPPNVHNANYLRTKRDKLGHEILRNS
ncbi:MAG: bifunctional 3,4-dihydroxy-2-butanone-4-phosphate synthase/GTP cyclohydrolase II [Leptospirales bacterium]|nr:bifunctional 3,4-dihydroxy-2-butanone-4-phosphate synthase/GTP cyclohydrolase II [Leptospirales bacterium]